jgi:hypothetical protein
MSTANARCQSGELFENGQSTMSHLASLRHQCDKHGDAVILAIQHRNRRETVEEGYPRQKQDLFTTLEASHSEDPIMESFWADTYTVPQWVDWRQLERGQRVFHRYISASIAGFVLQGFVGENSSASGVVEVLVRTGGFSERNLLRRLKETFHWLIEVTRNVQSIQPGGKGHADTIRVRLLHAQVRQRILALSKQKPDYYDETKFGIPINTLDSVHSISTFCCSPLLSQLPKIGISPSESEIRDYIALFRYLAYLLGVPQHFFESVEQAKKIMDAMAEYESRPNATSRIVAGNFIRTVTSTTPQSVSVGFIAAGSRSLNGDVLCDALGICRPGWIHYATFQGCCWFAVTMSHLQWWFPALDEALIYVSNSNTEQVQRRWWLTRSHSTLG